MDKGERYPHSEMRRKKRQKKTLETDNARLRELLRGCRGCLEQARDYGTLSREKKRQYWAACKALYYKLSAALEPEQRKG